MPTLPKTVTALFCAAALTGVCVAQKPADSIDLSVYSPPFSSLYVYSASERDMGNVHGEAEFFRGFDFCVRELFRITKPGRLTCCHVAQLAAMLHLETSVFE